MSLGALKWEKFPYLKGSWLPVLIDLPINIEEPCA